MEELLVAVGMDADGLTADADRAASGVEKSLNGIAGAAAGLGVGGAFAMALDSAMDITATTNKLTNQLGLTEDEAARVGHDSAAVYAAGWGESVDQIGEALGAVESSIGALGTTSDAQLQQMTKEALALADTFEFDVGEATQAAGNLIKSGLAKDGEQAFDLLTAAAQKLPPALREELPALTNEYSTFFSQLGFSGEDAFGVLVEAAQNPIFELDKVGDALKELSLRLADTATVTDPLKSIGLDVAKIQKLVNEGQGTVAFDEIITGLKGVQDQTKRTAIQAALFGGPGEDMGNTLLQLEATGAAANAGLEDAAGGAAKIAASMQSSPAQQLDSIMRTLSTTLGEALAPALKWVSDFLQDNPGLVSALTPVIIALAAALAVWTAVQWALNSALLANPLTWVVLGIVALVAILMVAWQRSDTFREIVTACWEAVWSVLKGVFTWITGTLWPGVQAAWSAISNGAVAAATWIRDAFNSVVGFVTGLPGRIAAAAAGMWDGITHAFRSAINWIIGKWNGLSFGIPSISIPGIGTVGGGSFRVPQIPMLASGGVVPATSGGMLALLGEGGQDEAVVPLDRLDGMLRSVAGAVRSTGSDTGVCTTRVVLDVTGADQELKALFQRIVKIDGRGDVQTAFGQ